jgi:hypothetical protein
MEQRREQLVEEYASGSGRGTYWRGWSVASRRGTVRTWRSTWGGWSGWPDPCRRPTPCGCWPRTPSGPSARTRGAGYAGSAVSSSRSKTEGIAEEPERAVAQSATVESQGRVQRPWWRRMFRG